MKSNLKLARRRTLDDWEEFRPHVAPPTRSRSAGSKVLISALFFAAIVIIWIWFKPSISGTMEQIRSAVREMASGRVAVRKSPLPTPAAAVHRAPPRSAVSHAYSAQDGARVPGPFEVYLLDGDRFIRVDSSSRSILLNTETGETTWIDSEATANRRQGIATPEN